MNKIVLACAITGIVLAIILGIIVSHEAVIYKTKQSEQADKNYYNWLLTSTCSDLTDSVNEHEQKNKGYWLPNTNELLIKAQQVKCNEENYEP